MYRTVNILIAVLVLASAAYAQDDWINHPVKCYRHVRIPPEMRQDSAVEAIITFNPLPLYMQPSRVSIEYYSRYDAEGDVTIKYADYDNSYTMMPLELTWPGPISKGDTLRAEFTIIPRVIGVINLRFVTTTPYGPIEYRGEVINETSHALLNAQFTLGADGKVMAMNSYATGKDYAPFLGPLPEAMTDSLILPYPEYWPQYFVNEAIFFIQPDDSGYRHVKCKVSPKYAYDTGMHLEVSHPEDIHTKNEKLTCTDPVAPGDTIVFSFDIKKTTTKITRMVIRMVADNPDSGNARGKTRNPSKRLIERWQVYIAYDDNMNLLFITHRDPYVSIPHMRDGKFHTPRHYLNQKDRDPRISWVEEMYKKNR